MKEVKKWKLFGADLGVDSAREVREYFIPGFSKWKEHDSYQAALRGLVGVIIRCEILDMVFSQTQSTPEYLDSIASHGAFGEVNLCRHGVLCDYCFFGGPTRTAWKKPTHPTPDFV